MKLNDLLISLLLLSAIGVMAITGYWAHQEALNTAEFRNQVKAAGRIAICPCRPAPNRCCPNTGALPR